MRRITTNNKTTTTAATASSDFHSQAFNAQDFTAKLKPLSRNLFPLRATEQASPRSQERTAPCTPELSQVSQLLKELPLLTLKSKTIKK